MRRTRFLLVVLPLAALLLGGSLTWPRSVTGIVRDANGPIAGATVRFRAGDKATITDAEGRFILADQSYAPHQVVTAWKEGYNPAGVDLSVPGAPTGNPTGAISPSQILLTLKRHPTADDPTYQWLTSHADPNQALGCGHCMTNYEEWRGDAHALSAQNPVFLSLYSATNANGQSDGLGWRADSPVDAGNCATCHAPAAALAQPGLADPTQLSGVEREGVFCDLCHKIAGVKLDPITRLPDPALPGIASYALSRPAPNTQIFYGTIDDTVRRVSKLDLERKSAYCAPCHSGGWWGQSVYASYDEWLASPYVEEGKECQDCHMLPNPDAHRLTSACGPAQQRDALGELGCKLQSCVDCHIKPSDKPTQSTLAAVALIGDRPSGSIRSHRMAGVRDEAFLRSSVTMTATAIQGTDGVLVEIALSNTGAGHHVPSDSPLRNMILLVNASDAGGEPLTYTGREVVPDWGGVGQSANDYAGRPGKGFAKVIEDWDGTAPAPAWRNGAQIRSDNRIPARATDRSSYTFALPSSGASGPIRVQVRLIFRRVFKPWADAKGWDLPDLTMGEASAFASRVDRPVLDTLPQVRDKSRFAPSAATTATGTRLPAGAIAPPQTCQACHADEVATWRTTGHAQAAATPLFRAWYKAAGQDTNGAVSGFCAGCHMPAGLLTGQIRSRWAWGGREYAPLDESAQAGVSCAICHGMVGATGTGNGAYVLDNRLSTHASAIDAPARDEAAACAACHEATNPSNGFPVMTTYSEWRDSAFGNRSSAGYRTCQTCHVVTTTGHAGLTAQQLRGAITIDLPPGPTAARGRPYTLAIDLTNAGAGHAFPTGAAELRQVWLEVTVHDATGAVLFTSGAVDAYGDAVAPTARYGVTWQDDAGNPTDRLWDAAALLWELRIPAGGSVREEVTLDVPTAVQGPLRIAATLRYRQASGYLGALMTTYLGEPVGADALVIAQGQRMVEVR